MVSKPVQTYFNPSKQKIVTMFYIFDVYNGGVSKITSRLVMLSSISMLSNFIFICKNCKHQEKVIPTTSSGLRILPMPSSEKYCQVTFFILFKLWSSFIQNYIEIFQKTTGASSGKSFIVLECSSICPNSTQDGLTSTCCTSDNCYVDNSLSTVTNKTVSTCVSDNGIQTCNAPSNKYCMVNWVVCKL